MKTELEKELDKADHYAKHHNDIKPLGAAEIRVTLSEGKLIVRHFDGGLLYDRQAAAGNWDEIWKALQSEPPTFQTLEEFLVQPGINIAGICQEAEIAQQYLNRCRKEKKLPGESVMKKLLPVIKKYGF